MNETMLLIKANITNTLGLNRLTKLKSRGEKAKIIAIGFAILYAIVSSLGGLFFINYRISTFLIEMNALDRLLIMGFISTSFISIFMSIYKAPGYLYSFKDFDLLMSLPLKNTSVLMSKIFFLYMSNLMLTLLLGIPPFIVYALQADKGPIFYILMVLLMLFIPIVPMLIGSFLSLILGRISSRFKKSNAIILIGSFLLILIFMAGSTLLNTVSKKQIQGSGLLFDQFTHIYFPAKLFLKALVETDLVSMLLFTLIYLAIFLAFVLYFAKSFKRINARMNESYSGVAYKMKALQVSSPLKALVRKEIKYYFSTYIYVLNTGMGVVMMTIFAVGVPLFRQQAISTALKLPSIQGYIAPSFMAVLLFCIGMTYITAVSISLEGKNLWIIKSLPIKETEIIKSKILLQLIVTVPALLIDTTILAICMHFEWSEYIVILVLGVVFSVFIALMGIIINLIFPKMDWKSPVVVVKQSASALVATFFSFTIMALMIVPYVLIKPNFVAYSAIIIVVLFLLNMTSWLWIKSKGVKIFQQL